MKFISIVALLLASAALTVTLYREFDSETPVWTSTGDSKETAETDASLRIELRKLQLKIAALEKAAAKKDREIQPVPVLQEQVAEIATFQEDLAEYALNIDPLDVIGVTEREIETAYSKLLDESLPAGERSKQAALLKKYDLFDEEAVASMTNLFFNAESPPEKAAALVALKGHVSPEVRDDVLESFSTEIADGYKNARFRYHGIEALEPLLPNPEVEAMLTVIAQNDPQIKIANRAAKSVGLPSRPKSQATKNSDGPSDSAVTAATDG